MHHKLHKMFLINILTPKKNTVITSINNVISANNKKKRKKKSRQICFDFGTIYYDICIQIQTRLFSSTKKIINERQQNRCDPQNHVHIGERD
jgi:hypothetical protein